MSEETTNYGIPNTTPDTEQYPPQTGDLLGGYIARLSARVRELEAASTETSAYQRSLEARIERMEALIERLMARMDVLDNIVEDYITFGCDPDSCRRPEPTAEPAATTPIVTRERTHGRYGTRNLTKSKPIPSGEHRGDFFASDPGDVCARCGHVSASHNATWDTDTDSTKSWCNKKGCTCAGFLLAEPEPTAEPVCATCGHEEAYHLIGSDGNPMCRAGTLGKPCLCREYKPVAMG